MKRSAWLAAACLACLFGCEARPPHAPNVVLISIDSLRPDHLGSYGYERPTSPRMDALAARGVRFSQAVSSTSWTLPAHASLFTSLPDSAHGLVDNGLRLADGHATLAERFQRAGYHTAGFYGAPYLAPTFGLAQGFDHYESCMSPLPEGADVRQLARAVVAPAHADVTGPRTRDAIRRWLERDSNQPFFLFVHLWDVHYDYIPPARYVALFDPDYEGPIDGTGVIHNPAIHAGMPVRDLAHLIARYDGEIRFTDDIVGEILDDVNRAAGERPTLVAITADHGEEFFEHGGKGHQRTLFDEVLRVPLILHGPGLVPEGLVIDRQVRLMDLSPTLLALAGLDAPPSMRGQDLSPLLRGRALAPDPALAELRVRPYLKIALRTEETKLVVLPRKRGYTLFELAADPEERHPVPASDPRYLPSVRRLQALVAEAEALRAAGPGVEAAEDEAMTERLRALGYVE